MGGRGTVGRQGGGGGEERSRGSVCRDLGRRGRGRSRGVPLPEVADAAAAAAPRHSRDGDLRDLEVAVRSPAPALNLHDARAIQTLERESTFIQTNSSERIPDRGGCV